MSASTGPSSKGEKSTRSKFQSLDINSIYKNNRSEVSEAQTTKSTIPRKHGMQQLGKVPQRRPPANLPSLKSENSGNDPSVSLVPTGGTGWGVKTGESHQLTASGGGSNNCVSQNNQNVAPHQNQNTTIVSPAPVVGPPPAPTLPSSAPSNASQASSHHDKTWSSVTGGSQASGLGMEHGPLFLAHQSPQFHQEFPSLSGEPGGAPAHPSPAYGPGPSLRPQTEPGSWSQGTHSKPTQSQNNNANMNAQFKSVVPPFLISQGTGFPIFPESILKKPRNQTSHPENRLNRMAPGQNASRPLLSGGNQSGGSGNTGESEDLILSRPIIREEELDKMDELTRDPSWAANDDIDYNEQLSFSDGESVGEDEKENKLRDKSKQQPPIRDDKKEEIEKNNREKPFMSERDRNQQAWRVGNNTYSDFRNTSSRQLIPGNRIDNDDEIWKEKRRQTTEHKMAAAEKAKQRKEEEEKRYEESRAKKYNKDVSDFHSSMSSSFSEWDKEDRAKSSENFKQMIQFPLEGRQNMNRERERERDIRRDRGDIQFSSRNQSKPPRFRQKEAAKQQYVGLSGGFEKNWSTHNSFGRRGGGGGGGPESLDKDDNFCKDRHDRPSPSDSGPDRFSRPNMRDDRHIDSNKRNYYDNNHMDSFQSSRDVDKEKDAKNNYDCRMNEKDSGSRDNDKDRESTKTEHDSRNCNDRMRRDNKPINNFQKQTNDYFEEKDSEWRNRPGRPESQDRPDRMDRESRSDHKLESRMESQDVRGDNRHENQDSIRPEVRDRPSRPDSQESRVSRDSRNSKDSSDKPLLLDGEYPIHDNYLSDKMERLSFKGKDMRREPVQRVRDHVPGPITQEKLVAYEHKHSQSQMEKGDNQEKDNEDKKMKKLNEVDNISQVWGDSREEKGSPMQETSAAPQEPSRTDFSHEESKGICKSDDMDKRKENGSNMRERRDDKPPGGGGGRGNRNRGGGSRSSNYNVGSKYNMYPGPNWQSKERQRQGSSRGHKHWNQSESDGSGDEMSAESSKDDKKTDNRKQDCSTKFSTWKNDNKDRWDDKKDMKMGGENDKDKMKGDKKSDGRGGNIGEGGGRKGGDGGGFAPRPTGEPSRRGRGGGGMRGQTRLGMAPALYGPPGSKPFSSSSGGPQQPNSSSLSLDSQDKQFSPPQQSGRKDDGQGGGKGREGDKTPRGKGGGGMHDENWENTSETSDGSEAKKSNKNRNKSERKSRGTIGDKRNLLNSGSAHLNGRPDSKPEDSGNEKKSNKDDPEASGYSNNGFQEVKSKKTGREGRGQGNVKDEVKRSQSKNKDKSGGGVKSQQKSYTREFVNNKPPRMQRLDSTRKQQQQQQQLASQDVSDMNKINQTVSSLFPISRNSDVSNSCPPPPSHNAWIKPINASLRTTPPLSTTLTQLTAAPAQITTEKPNMEELSQPGNPVQATSPTADKAITKMSREAVEKNKLEGPPVNTIIFENTNYKRDPGDIGMKQRYPMKPNRAPMDKTRERKIEDELTEGNHSMSLGGFKSASDLQASEGKPQDNIQVPISFGKNEDNADMKLDFPFDSDLTQLSDDKTNQSIHVGQSSAADLNQKIASVKKVWDSAPISAHVDEGATSSFTQGFATDKSLDPTAPSHHSDHSDFNTADSVYGSGQLSSTGAYVATGSSMMKQDTIVSNTNTMCKANMFQVSPQAQQVTVMPHPGPLSTPPPIPNVLSFQGYSSNLSAVSSPPNVLYNSQQAGGPQTEIYQTYLSTAQMHGSGSRSFEFSPSYNMSQNSTFQPNIYMPSPPPNAPSVFQNATQAYRLPHGSAAALSQQMNSNASTMLMSSSSSSVVSGSQVKSTQGSMQPTAIGSKSGGGPPTAYAPPSPQILLIEPSVNFLPQGYHRPATIQHSSSYFATNSALTAGGSTGGLFNPPPSLLSGGGGGATTASLPSASPFGVQPPNVASYSQQQPPSSTQPPTHHQQAPYPTQPQMGGSYRSQTTYAKSGQHPTDTSKSSSDQFQSMFQPSVQGSPKPPPRVSAVKPQSQSSASLQSQQHKFSYNTNPHSVSQNNLGYQMSSASNGTSRQVQAQQVMRSGGSVAPVATPPARYNAPIQRPMSQSYSQQQVQPQQAAMLQQQQARQQQHRMQPSHQSRPSSSSQPQQPKQYYQQPGGGMKLEGGESVKSEVEDQSKTSQDKSAKDETQSEQ